MAGGKGKSSGGKSSGGKTSVDGPKKQQSHSARAGLQVCRRICAMQLSARLLDPLLACCRRCRRRYPSSPALKHHAPDSYAFLKTSAGFFDRHTPQHRSLHHPIRRSISARAHFDRENSRAMEFAGCLAVLLSCLVLNPAFIFCAS